MTTFVGADRGVSETDRPGARGREQSAPGPRDWPGTGQRERLSPALREKFRSVQKAISDIAAGRPVVVVDDEDRENEGDLVFAADHVTPELVAFMMAECRGLLCVPMEGRVLDRLEIGAMVEKNTERHGTAFTVSVDALEGTTTGISAGDRTRTIKVLASPDSLPGDLVRPGHVFPLRAKTGGVLRRAGHTEAAVDLARLAGLTPVGVICEIINPDGTMARMPQLREFIQQHGLTLVSIADLVAYRRATERQIERAAETRLPTEHGTFHAVGYRALTDGSELVALVHGELGDGEDVLVRVHSECLTGDVFGSLRCDCGPQLAAAMDRVTAEGRGVVLYMRGHEGRGIGLMHKLQAYQLQDQGLDTVDANLDLGLPADARDYTTGAQALADLGIRSMRLLTNNPAKRAGLEGQGVRITGREPLPVRAHPENLRYLRTKRDRMGHLLDGLDAPSPRPTTSLDSETPSDVIPDPIEEMA
jgi:3,4-dihydroxy 2-butanone 4-phosphate synthase/GTP cyclohydrolase II